MPIVFRKMTQEEYDLLRSSLAEWLTEEQTKKFLSKNFFIVGEGKQRELFISNKAVDKFFEKNPKISPYSIGLGFGEFKKEEVFLTLSGASIIAQETFKQIKINQEAEQLFLYRRNILCKSILELDFSLSKNEKVMVLNKSGDFLGIGKLKISGKEIFLEKNFEKTAIENILDLGWYLRKGK